MKVKVKALPVSDILIDLSDQFHTKLDDDSGELTLNIPENLGTGFIRGSSFASGMGIIEYNCCFFEDTEIHFTIHKTHPLKFIFCSEGEVNHTFEEDNDVHTIHNYQNIIVSSSGHNGHVLCFKANQKSHVSSLEIIREKFARRNNHHFKNLEPQLKQLFEDSVAEKKFFYQGNYSLKAADLVEEISNKSFTGFLRNIFLEGKLFEMLVLQINQYHDDLRDDKLPQILRRSDVEKVKKASELINNNLDQNFSVDYLAKEVGTNVNKLQDGFKHLYDLTVNKYVQQAKLEAAKEMLISTDNNISQIVSRIGLNNRSYFSKIFKEKYGVSPKYFSKAKRDEDEEETPVA